MKNIGEKVLGWFVVTEDDDARPATLARAPSLPDEEDDAPALPAMPIEGAPPIDGRLAKFLDLIESLPDGAPPEVKRAIVVASLEAFGISVDGVVSAAAQADASLDTILAEVGETKRQLEAQMKAQEERAKSVTREKARLRGVAAFFGKSGR